MAIRPEPVYTSAELGSARDTALATARRLGLSLDDAEDVAQLALVRLTEHDCRPDNIDAWITTVTRNLSVDELRRRNRHLQREDDPLTEESPVGARALMYEFVARGKPASLAGMQGPAMDHIVARLSAELSERDLQVVSLAMQGVPHTQIAARLGYKNAQTVKATMHRIRVKVAHLAVDLGDMAGHPRPY